MRYRNTDQLKGFLASDINPSIKALADHAEFELLADDVAYFLTVLERQGIPDAERDDHAVFMCLTHPDSASQHPSLSMPVVVESQPSTVLNLELFTKELRWSRWTGVIGNILLLLLLLLLFTQKAHAQNPNEAIVVASCGTAPSNYPSAGGRAPLTVDVNGNVCTPTAAGGTSSTIGNASPSSGTLAGFRDTNGNMQPAQLDAAGLGANLKVNCTVGCNAATDTVGSPVTLNSASGANSHADINMAGQRGASVSFAPGNFVGQLIAYCSLDGGTHFDSVNLAQPGTGATNGNFAVLVNPSDIEYALVIPGPVSNCKIQVTSYTSGSVVATLRATGANIQSYLYAYSNSLGTAVTLQGADDGALVAGGWVTTSAPSYTNGHAKQLSLTTVGALRVDGSGVTQPTTAKLQDNSGNGITSTSNALDVNIKSGGSLGYNQGSTTSGQVGALTQAAVTTSAPSYTTGQTSPLSMDTAGNLRVNAAVGVTQGSTTSGQTGPLVQGAVTTSAPTYTNGQTSPLSLDTTGALRVNAAVGVAQGSTTASQTGPLVQCAVTTSAPTYTTAQTDPVSCDTSGNTRVVTPGITFNSTPTTLTNGGVGDFQIDNKQALKVVPGDNGFTTVVTQASAGNLNATVTGNGAAGSPAAGVLSVQGISGMTAIKVDGSAVTQPISGTVSGTGSFTVAQATGTNLHIVCDGGTCGSSSTTDNSAFTAGTSSANPVGGFYHASRDSLTDGRSGALALTVNRAALVTVEDASKNPILGSQTDAKDTHTDGTAISMMQVFKQISASVQAPPAVNQGNTGSNAQSWWAQIGDTARGPVTVKAARVQPALADIALTTALSPNNGGLPVNLIQIVQKTNQISSGSVASINVAFGSNNIQGNSIIVNFCNGNNNNPAAPITDTNTNTYFKAIQVANGSAFECEIWYSTNIAAGANTVTVTPGGSNASIAMEIYEVSGMLALSQAPNQPDVSTSNTSGSAGTSPAITLTPSAPNGYSFVAFGLGTAAQTITVAAPYANDSGQQNPTTPAGLFSFVSASEFLGAIAASSPSATATSEPWAVAAAVFKPVAITVSGSMNLDSWANTILGAPTNFGTTPGAVIAGSMNASLFAGTTALSQTGGSLNTNITGGSLAANQSVNEAQIAGTSTSVNNGTADAGTARGAIASNNSAIANWGHGATGAAVPSGATYVGAQNSGGLTGLIICDKYAKDRTSTADVQLVAISGSTKIYICGYTITGESTTGSDVNFRTDTNSNCTTAPTDVTPPITIGTSTSGGMIAGKVVNSPFWNGLAATASRNLCVHRSAAQTSEVEVLYTQF